MPKKQKNPKKQFKISWKSAILAILAIVLTIAVIIQIWFNIFVWQSLQYSAAFQMRTLLVSGLEGLDDLHQTPDSQDRIPEARIALPAETDDTRGIMYTYNKAEEDQTESLVVTSKSLNHTAIGSIPGYSIDDIFKQLPSAQACTRGATIYFNTSQPETTSESMELEGTVKLTDGRTMYIWSEKACGTAVDKDDSTSESRKEVLKNLTKHLLQAKSY